jgi:hypothetical protein
VEEKIKHILMPANWRSRTTNPKNTRKKTPYLNARIVEEQKLNETKQPELNARIVEEQRQKKCILMPA